jgi:DNA repair photolyase
MIVPYWGEFLVSPAPLELSLNRCSHACSYCFTNLNDPRPRPADVPALMRTFAEFRERDTYLAFLMRERYPTVISNRTDPFSFNNWQQTLAVLEVMASLELPVVLQTKGGQGIEEALKLVRPSLWYVSIPSLEDDVRAKVEPGAPPIADRLALLERLATRGHSVIVGVNPCVPEWLGEPEPLMAALAGRGVRGVWIERLHLNYTQERNMKPWQAKALGSDLIARAKRRRCEPWEFARIMLAREAAREAGLQVFSVGQPEGSYLMDWSGVYAKTFPTAQGFINYCHANEWAGARLISYQDFLDYMLPLLPQGKWGIDSYLGSTAHNIWWEKKVPPRMTFRELLGIIWIERRTRNCPVRMPAFAWAGRPEGEGWAQYVDEQEMPFLVFDPDGFDDYFAHVELGLASPGEQPMAAEA